MATRDSSSIISFFRFYFRVLWMIGPSGTLVPWTPFFNIYIVCIKTKKYFFPASFNSYHIFELWHSISIPCNRDTSMNRPYFLILPYLCASITPNTIRSRHVYCFQGSGASPPLGAEAMPQQLVVWCSDRNSVKLICNPWLGSFTNTP